MKTIVSIHFYLICMLFTLSGNAQLILVTGSVLNGNTGKALENVSVYEANSGIGTITNMNGYFSLMLKKGNAELIVSKESYKDYSKILLLQKDTVLTVQMMLVLNHKSKVKTSELQKTAQKNEAQNK